MRELVERLRDVALGFDGAEEANASIEVVARVMRSQAATVREAADAIERQEALREENARLAAKCDQYQADWMAAKHEFGDKVLRLHDENARLEKERDEARTEVERLQGAIRVVQLRCARLVD